MLPVSASFADLTTVRVPTTPRGKSWKMSLVPGKSWNLLGQRGQTMARMRPAGRSLPTPGLARFLKFYSEYLNHNQ